MKKKSREIFVFHWPRNGEGGIIRQFHVCPKWQDGKYQISYRNNHIFCNMTTAI